MTVRIRKRGFDVTYLLMIDVTNFAFQKIIASPFNLIRSKNISLRNSFLFFRNTHIYFSIAYNSVVNNRIVAGSNDLCCY